ncbi:uncharacterized protein [Macrobrachium rosenbergii]
MESLPDLSLHVLTPDDFHEVMQLLQRTFFEREVLSVALGCSAEDLAEKTSKAVKECLENGVSFGLRETKTTNLVAVKFCDVLSRKREPTTAPEENITRMEKIVVGVVNSVPPPECLFDDPSVEKILYGRITNIDPSYTGKNLPIVLQEACERAGIEAGCQLFYSQVANKNHLRKMIQKGCHVLQTSRVRDVSVDGQQVTVKSDDEDFSISALVKVLIPGNYRIKSCL